MYRANDTIGLRNVWGRSRKSSHDVLICIKKVSPFMSPRSSVAEKVFLPCWDNVKALLFTDRVLA